MSEIARSLREARAAKGWSQRELSERSGLPQAHISRIESGATDPKSSTVQGLSRLLDLELVLVPRQALTAVEAVLQDARREAASQPVRASASRLARLAERLRRVDPRDPVGDRLFALAQDLAGQEPAFARSPEAVSDLQQVVGEIELAVDAGRAVSPLVSRLERLRDAITRPLPDALRPAYSLDGDED